MTAQRIRILLPLWYWIRCEFRKSRINPFMGRRQPHLKQKKNNKPKKKNIKSREWNCYSYRKNNAKTCYNERASIIFQFTTLYRIWFYLARGRTMYTLYSHTHFACFFPTHFLFLFYEHIPLGRYCSSFYLCTTYEHLMSPPKTTANYNNFVCIITTYPLFPWCKFKELDFFWF